MIGDGADASSDAGEGNADESSAAGETSAEESQEAQTEAPESAGESSDAAVAIQHSIQIKDIFYRFTCEQLIYKLIK